MQHCNDDVECEFPIAVSLYNAGARGQTVGSVNHDDDVVLFPETCHANGSDGAYLSSVDGTGRLYARSELPR